MAFHQCLLCDRCVNPPCNQPLLSSRLPCFVAPHSSLTYTPTGTNTADSFEYTITCNGQVRAFGGGGGVIGYRNGRACAGDLSRPSDTERKGTAMRMTPLTCKKLVAGSAEPGWMTSPHTIASVYALNNMGSLGSGRGGPLAQQAVTPAAACKGY
jgi:hypothetical protein